MTSPISRVLPLLLLVISTSTLFADQHLYLSAGNKITIYKIDDASGELHQVQSIDLAGAGPLGMSRDRSKLYASANSIDSKMARGGSIATYEIESTGKLKRLAHAASSIKPGYLMTDASDSFLAGNNYAAGVASTWKLEDRVYRGQKVQSLKLEPKAHSVAFDPTNGWLLVPATGPNKVFQNRFDVKTGEIHPSDSPFASGPTGSGDAQQPRHLIFHPHKSFAYTTNEREKPGVGVWSWDAAAGQLQPVQNIVTYPEGFDGEITTADLHMTPDARFLYVSNRDITDRKAKTGNDSIVAFSVDVGNGRLSMIDHFACEHVPRSFNIDTTGTFVYVAGQGDDRLGVYRIDKQSGKLTKVTAYDVGARPSWVTIL